MECLTLWSGLIGMLWQISSDSGAEIMRNGAPLDGHPLFDKDGSLEMTRR
jgi:hypothetical protein